MFQHIYNCICEFQCKVTPPFALPREESMLMVQADSQGYQDTQMSQDSLKITIQLWRRSWSCIPALFPGEQIKPCQSLLKSTVNNLQSKLHTIIYHHVYQAKCHLNYFIKKKNISTISAAVAVQSLSSSECSEVVMNLLKVYLMMEI